MRCHRRVCRAFLVTCHRALAEMTVVITKERAERIARSQPCPRCKEYTYKKLKLRAAVAGDQIAGAAWFAEMVCGVCSAHLQLALESDGDVLFFN